MDTIPSLGLWIRRRRKAFDLTQEDLALRVGCAAITLRKIESDERRPSRQIAERLADQFQLNQQERAAFLQAVQLDLCPDQLPALPHAPIALPVISSPSIHPADLPRGTLTFLLSEALPDWSSEPDTFQLLTQIANQVFQIFTTTITTYHGQLIKRDGLSWGAVFSEAASAVHAALAIQEQLQHATASSDPIPLRIALHSGTAMLLGSTYVGPTIHHATNLLAIAHPGQILLSRVTYDLVHTLLPTSALVRDLGLHHLSETSPPEPLLQISTSVLRTEFPPQPTWRRQRHNLPTLLTSLLGREHDIDTISRLLQQPNIRLLTLTGAGGMGKTRLAVQVATDLLPSFTDGVIFVDLSPLRTPEAVLPAIGAALGVLEQSGTPLLQTIVNTLRVQDLLLVLDNFEHVLPAAPLLTTLLAEVPRLKVLVTSRAVLHVRGEHEYDVPPLALPDPAIPWLAATIEQSPAVALFVRCVHTIQPHFALTDQNAQAIAEICTQLDGLPLAIELAAARCKLLSPQALLARLSHRLRMLVGGARDLPNRQQSLRAAIDWSYQLLSPTEQRLFCSLGVFAGGATLSVIEALWYADNGLSMDEESDPAWLLEGLSILVDHSLLRCREDADGEPRFVLLETIREYALEQLEQTGEHARIQALHAQIYQQLVEASAGDARGPRQALWFAQIEREHHNIRAALRWAIDTRHRAIAVRLCRHLQYFWLLRCHLSEGRCWIEQTLGCATPASNSDVRDETMLEIALAEMLSLLGEWQAAERHLQTVRERVMHLNDPILAAQAARVAGDILCNAGRYVEALRELERARDIFTTHRAHHDLVQTLRNISRAHFQQGHYAEVLGNSEACLQLATKIGDYYGCCAALNNLGTVAGERGHYRQAIDYFTRGLAIAEEHQFLQDRTVLMGNLGRAYFALGEYVRAYAQQLRKLELALTLGLHEETVLALVYLGANYAQVGQYAHAQQCYHAALARMQILDPRLLAGGLCHLAQVTERQGDTVLAGQLYGRVIAVCRTFAIRFWLAQALHDQACYELRQHRYAEAQHCNNEALAIAIELESRKHQFPSQVLSIRLQVLLKHLGLSSAIAQLEALRSSWSEPQQQALIDDTIWRINPSHDDARAAAARQYHALYANTPSIDYRQRYYELTGEWLAETPQIPHPPPIVHQHTLDLPSFFARVDMLLATQLDRLRCDKA